METSRNTRRPPAGSGPSGVMYGSRRYPVAGSETGLSLGRAMRQDSCNTLVKVLGKAEARWAVPRTARSHDLRFCGEAASKIARPGIDPSRHSSARAGRWVESARSASNGCDAVGSLPLERATGRSNPVSRHREQGQTRDLISSLGE